MKEDVHRGNKHMNKSSPIAVIEEMLIKARILIWMVKIKIKKTDSIKYG